MSVALAGSRMPYLQPLPASLLAFITTLHIAMVVLRKHRSPAAGIFSFVTPVSLMLSATPWFMPVPAGVISGLAAHIGWFFACERLLPVPVGVAAAPPLPTRMPAVKPVVRPPATTPRPAASPRPAAAPARAPSPAPTSARPRDFVQVPVLAVFDEARDIKTFRFARPDGFDFQAGQFVTIRLRADGKEHVRCYSISSRPEARGYMEISVKRFGLVSSTLHATVRPGSTVSLRAPAGAFLYPGGDDRPIVMIAGGIGITPLMSMLRHGLDVEPARPVTLVYSVRTPEDIAFHDEIKMLGRRHPQFSPVVAVTDVQGTGTGMFPGRITPDFLSITVPDINHSTCMVCGPPMMIDDVKAMLIGMNVSTTQIQYEIFQAAVAASAGAPVREPVEAAAPAPASYEIRFERSGCATRIPPGETLLEAAERCNAPVPSLCRAGVCGTCRTRVVSGDAECPSQMLDERDRADGYVLPCVTVAHSDCVLEA